MDKKKVAHYAEIQQASNNIVDTNHTFLQTPKQELAEIF